MTDYSKITALYSRLSVGDEDRDGGESNSIQNQKIFLENYARGQHLRLVMRVGKRGHGGIAVSKLAQIPHGGLQFPSRYRSASRYKIRSALSVT